MQTIRTAEMADIHTVVLARGKKATPDMIALAHQNSMMLLETPFSIFKTSGILYQHGVKPLY
jgi:serine kinase of HPr protein (carbohydrate metabolism regulator)